MNQEKQPTGIYELVTTQIIEQLKQKNVPWRKPWTETGTPQNLLSRAPYHGINLWLLASLGYEQNLFLTWKQLKILGGSVKKGERGQIVVFWKKLPPKEEKEGSEKIQTSLLVLRYYKVFNIAQCSDIPTHLIPEKSEETPFVSIPRCEQIIAEMRECPNIVHEEDEAFYNSDADYINMPKPESFKSNEQYYSVLFHELVHSTGHTSRLNRKDVMAEDVVFGDKRYSLEELTAEIGACFLCSLCGIGEKHFKQNVAYITNWIKALKNDHKMIFLASSRAQKAIDYILNIQVPEKN